MQKSKTTRSALLSSVTALLLCLAMLIGTTFAWFTDTATTSVNTIQAGTLDIVLEMWDGEEWVNAEGETLDFVKAADGKGQDVLWEPGCTYALPNIRIRNNGNLALKYKIVITGINGSEKLNEAIEWDIKLGESEGPLDTYEGHLTANGTDTASETLTISGHMPETVGNEYQGLAISGISISVVATQDTVEYDSFEKTYDENAEYLVEVTNHNDFSTALRTTGYAKVTNNGNFFVSKTIMATPTAVITAEEGTNPLIYANTNTWEGVVNFAPQSNNDAFFERNDVFNVSLGENVEICGWAKGHTGIVLGNPNSYDADGNWIQSGSEVVPQSYRSSGKTLNIDGGIISSASGSGVGAIFVASMTDSAVNVSNAKLVLYNDTAAFVALSNRGAHYDRGYYSDISVQNTTVTFTNCTFVDKNGNEITDIASNSSLGTWFYGFGGDSGNKLIIDGVTIIG